MNNFALNNAIRTKFPDPATAVTCLGSELGTAPGSMLVTAENAVAVLRAFQRDNINALADCLVDAAARFERTNASVTYDDLKREAQALRDYADTLLPEPEVATR